MPLTLPSLIWDVAGIRDGGTGRSLGSLLSFFALDNDSESRSRWHLRLDETDTSAYVFFLRSAQLSVFLARTYITGTCPSRLNGEPMLCDVLGARLPLDMK